MTVTTIAHKIVVFLENKTAMIYKPTVAIAYMYNLRQGHLNLKNHISC